MNLPVNRPNVALAELGCVPYEEALDLQRRLHRRRRAGEIGDVVLMLEHDPVITVGRSGSLESLLVPAERLDDEGIRLVEIERGGDMTYHGPGQLVVYPILDLQGHGKDVKGYVRRLEATAIETLAGFGIAADRRAGYPGVWAGSRKIASVGVYVKGWVTLHGLALNVDVNPHHFAMINPCGLGVETVSMVDLVDPERTENSVTMASVRKTFAQRMEDVFEWTFVPAEPSLRQGEDDDPTSALA